MCEYIFVTEFILRSSPELGKRIKFKICDAVGRIEKRLVGRAEETRAEPGSVRRGGYYKPGQRIALLYPRVLLYGTLV